MQRNGQNPIRSTKTFEHDGNKLNNSSANFAKANGTYGICPKCGTEVPPKPGFRLSALKCPKCQSPIVKK